MVLRDDRKKGRRATYQDVLDAPEHVVAELIEGVLYTSPRPGPRHATASSVLGAAILDKFHGRRGGPRNPGGWWILDEPELHFWRGKDRTIVVPDIAGWRLERMPRLPDTAYFAVMPDWVCEVVSPTSASHDRIRKMGLYAEFGVRHLWLVLPEDQAIEVFELREGVYARVAVHQGSKPARLVPFEAVALNLRRVWPEDFGETAGKRRKAATGA